LGFTKVRGQPRGGGGGAEEVIKGPAGGSSAPWRRLALVSEGGSMVRAPAGQVLPGASGLKRVGFTGGNTQWRGHGKQRRPLPGRSRRACPAPAGAASPGKVRGQEWRLSPASILVRVSGSGGFTGGQWAAARIHRGAVARVAGFPGQSGQAAWGFTARRGGTAAGTNGGVGGDWPGGGTAGHGRDQLFLGAPHGQTH